jgi:hypothetical protein
MKVLLVEGGGRLVTVKKGNNINTFNRGRHPQHPHNNKQLKQGPGSRRVTEVELLTKGGCHKEAAHCPRRPHAVTRRLQNCYKEAAGCQESNLPLLRRKRKMSV